MSRRHDNLGSTTVAIIVTVAVLSLPVPRGSSTAHAAEQPTMEYRLKAAFIYHFLHFTDWPPDAFAHDEAPIVVAVVGEDPFAGALQQALRDKRVGGRAVRLRHFANPPPPPPPALLGECH